MHSYKWVLRPVARWGASTPGQSGFSTADEVHIPCTFPLHGVGRGQLLGNKYLLIVLFQNKQPHAWIVQCQLYLVSITLNVPGLYDVLESQIPTAPAARVAQSVNISVY